ncbi:VOC family protein [Litchfieldia alkalitelluris]|uniref:VOC family protein n=1 Tax=Litchfieldia alkalitelluris TaxID=304268 RepID=UPI00099683EB|nr:VOC family protein [Litchfieldia alkalitelluris]
MPNYVTRISTIEIPVSNVEKSAHWYAKTLNLFIEHQSDQDAMLSFNAKGIPSIYLVQTNDDRKISFENTNTNVTHSVVDFYTYNLEGFYQFLKDSGIEVGPLNVNGEFGGFGFKDPDGNLLSATNIAHLGQE